MVQLGGKGLMVHTCIAWAREWAFAWTVNHACVESPRVSNPIYCVFASMHADQDITDEFEAIGHTPDAVETLHTYIIGVVADPKQTPVRLEHSNYTTQLAWIVDLSRMASMANP